MPAMPARWSADSVLALAPDDSSRRAAATLARPAPWDGAGASADLVWGLCAGSGKNPYQVVVDLADPAFKCSCPSRKFPCKHALALLMLWSAGTVPDAAEPADYARTWQEARQAKAERSRSSGTSAADSPGARWRPREHCARRKGAVRRDRREGRGGPNDERRRKGPSTGRKDEAAARRAAERAKRVTDGLADLREWLRDQVRAGLAAAGPPGDGNGPGER